MADLTVDPQVLADFANTVRPTLALASLEANMRRRVWENAVSVRRERLTGSSVNVPKLGALTPRSAAMDADADPAPLVLDADTLANLPILDLGDHMQVADEVIMHRDVDTVRDIGISLAQHEAESLDLIAGNAALAGSNVIFGGNKADAASLLAGDTFDASDVIRAKSRLTGYDGSASAQRFPEGYRAFVHSLHVQDAFASGGIQGFVDKAKYATPESFLAGEIGRWHGFTFFEAESANYEALAAGDDGGGNPDADLISALFCGAGYLGQAFSMAPTGPQGPFPAGDHMGRFYVLRWRAKLGYGRVREGNGIILKTRAAYAANP